METIIDIGINLMHRSFSGDREQVVREAAQSGVSPLIITGTDVRSSEEAARYAARFPGKLFCTAGVHPHDAKSCDKTTIPRLRELCTQKKAVAVGECGLDFDRNFSPPAVQRHWFEEQIQLAEQLCMPLFLHERSAHAEMMEILRKHPAAAERAVVHCFTGSATESLDYLSIGCCIGVTGWICDERRSAALRDAVRVIPQERLMVETDAPFLTPRDLPDRPDRNEPRFLPHIVERIACYMDCDPLELARSTARTTREFFRLP